LPSSGHHGFHISALSAQFALFFRLHAGNTNERNHCAAGTEEKRDS
jgi:hypothetical protein